MIRDEFISCQYNSVRMRWKPAFLLLSALLISLQYGEACQPRKNPESYETVKLKTGTLEIELRANDVVLQITKTDGTSIRNVLLTRDPTTSSLTKQTIVQECEDYTTCIKIGNVTHTKIKATDKSEVIRISRNVNHPGGRLTDCYQLNEDTHWFGGPQQRYQHWPIENMYYEEEPYVPTHPLNMAVTERYWLSSKGLYVFVDERDPLFLDQNNYRDRHICFVAQNKSPYRERQNVTLNYEIGVFQDPRLAHEYVVKNHFEKPTGHPNSRMVQHPIWSTWARYKVHVNDSVIRQFAKEILDHGYQNSQLEIDDNWETCYGSANFDESKFPDVAKLTSDLKALGFRVTLWIHPFINDNCESFNLAKAKNYFVKNADGSVKTSWWQGSSSGLIDFTNKDAVTWWVARLKKLQALGIDSFKFDAGEGSWAPQPPVFNGPPDLQPGIFTLNYTTNLAANFDDSIEVRVGWRTQRLPIFVRMIDKDSRWTWNNGLPTLITTLIQMNLNGYVFVLPDMIGGNGYVNNVVDSVELPSKELFVRWLQANVFMPSLQYSFVPWDYTDPEVLSISKQFTELHANISSIVMKAMKNAVETGALVNPPIWWVDPLNREAHGINDEFMLGEEVLVAPVTKEDAVSRDIYLPAGKWRDANTGKLYAGPMWLKEYEAPLNILPYFYKV